MSKLRKMKKAVNKYVLIICNHPDDAKANCKKYIADVKNLQLIINSYIDQTADLYQIWCDKSVKVFSLAENNFFIRFIRSFKMLIVNHYLNKFSYKLCVAGILERNLNILKQRLEQYEYLT